LKLIVKESTNNPNSILLVPNFGIAIKRLEFICEQLEIYRIDQVKNLTGITVDKETDLNKLIQMTTAIAGAVYSYAFSKEDHALMAKVNYKSSHIRRINQSEILAVAGVVIGEARLIPGVEIAAEGISDQELSTFEDLISRFKTIKSANREAVIDRSGTTLKINELFQEASTLLKVKLDRLAIQFKTKDPDFYQKYKASRKVLTRDKKKITEESPQSPIES